MVTKLIPIVALVFRRSTRVFVFKVLVQTSILPVCLSAQSIRFEPVKLIDFGLGFSTTTDAGFLGDLTGRTPSVGVAGHVKYNLNDPKVAVSIRAKASFDNWGNQSLRGTTEHRCEVKRSTATLGLLIGPPFDRQGNRGYICIESGLAHWDIKSTHAPLSDIKRYKYQAAFLLGGEGRYGYLEFGLDLYLLGQDIRVIITDIRYPDKDDIVTKYISQSKRNWGNLRISFGYKFGFF